MTSLIRGQFTLIFVLAILFLSVAPVEAEIALKPPLPSSEFSRFQQGVKKFTLSNGLRVISFHREYAPVFNGQTWVKVGGVNEVPGSTGIAHLLEHMAFKGTETIGTKDFSQERLLLQKLEQRIQARQESKSPKDTEELNSEISQIQAELEQFIVDNEFSRLYLAQGGTNLNAATAKDFTYYTVSLPKNAFELWCWMESERLLKPVFRQFYKELEVVQEERRMRTDDSPEGRLYETMLSTAFWNHPNRLPVIGWPSDLQRLTATELRTFRDTYYRPDNMVISLVGDLEEATVKSQMEKYFGRLPTPSSPLPVVTATEPEQNGARTAVVKFDAEPMFFLAYHKPTYPSPDDAQFAVVHTILGDGRSSIFQKELIQKKRIAVALDTSEEPGELYPNLFYVVGVPSRGISTDTLRKEVESVFERLKTTMMSSSELDSVKRRVRIGMLKALASDHEIGAAFGKAELLWNDWSAPLKAYDRILETTPADVQRLARTYFRKENSTYVVLERPVSGGKIAGGSK